MEHLLTSDRRRSDPPEAVDGAAGAESASVWMSSDFIIPTCQQLPLPASPPSRTIHHPVPKTRFFMPRADKTSAMADTTASSWGEESLGFDPTRYEEAEPIGSYPEAVVLWSPVESASFGADFLCLRRDTNRQDFVGGSAAYMGSAQYCEGANPQGGSTSEEVASAWTSCGFMIPTHQQLPLPASPPSLKMHRPVPKKRFFMSRETKTSAMADTRSFPKAFANQPALGRESSLGDRRFLSRGDTGVVGSFTTKAGNCAGIGSFTSLKHSKYCGGNKEAVLRQCAAAEATYYDDVIDLNVEEEEVGEPPYSADENCVIPIAGAAAEVAIAESSIENGGKVNNESGQGSTDYREDVSRHKPSPSPPRNKNIWEIGNRYRFVRNLGHGSYGEVAQFEDLEEGGYVAIKRIPNIFESEVKTKRIYREIFILGNIKHRDIINLKNVILPTNYENFKDLYLVFEFVDTDMEKLIGSPQVLRDDQIKLFLYQILNGLKFVHSTNVIHRDIKPANILLNKDCSLKICDFGLSRVVPEEPPSDTSSSGGSAANEEPSVQRRTLKRKLTAYVVTRWYRAPELILLQDYNKAVDVWSVGCIFAELLAMQEGSFSSPQERSALFPGKSCFPLSMENPTSYAGDRDQLNVIFDVIGTPSADDIKGLGDDDMSKYLEKLEVKPAVNLGEMFKGASLQALELLGMMLRFDPQKRITVDEALEHPYLASCRTREAEVTAGVPITMENEDIDMDMATLKRLVYEEVLRHSSSSKKRSRSDEGQEARDGSPKSRRLKY